MKEQIMGWPERCHLSAFCPRCLLAAPSLPTLVDFLLTDLCFEFLYLAASRLSIVLLSLQPSPPCMIPARKVANLISSTTQFDQHTLLCLSV